MVIESWINAGHDINKIESINSETFYNVYQANPNIEILDVRKQSEFESEHLIGAKNVPLDYIHSNENKIDKNKSYYVHCAGGYRSMTFISILKSKGYNHLIDVKGGITALKANGKFSLTSFKDPVTLL